MVTFLIVGCASQPGDSRAKQGAKSGAAIGAGIGLLLGVISGNSDVAARAVAVGAASGAIHGGYEGWRQDQDDARTREITRAIRNSSGQASGRDDEARQREHLTRFLGVWAMSGWIQEPERGRVSVSAQVNGNVQMNYFVELAYIDLEVEGLEGPIWGTTTLGYNPSVGFEITTRFNTLPDAIEFGGGSFNEGIRTFTFSDSAGTTAVQFQTPDRFTVTTTKDGATLESYVFTRQ